MVLLVVAPLALTSAIAWRGARATETRVMHDRLATAQATALTASGFIDAEIATVRALARSPDVSDLGARPDLNGVLTRALADVPEWESIEVFQANGQGVLGTGPDVQPLNIADRPYIQAALTTWQPVVGPVGVGQRSGGPAVPIVAPINFANTARGLLVVWLSTARLDEVIASTARGAQSQVILRDSAGRMLAPGDEALALARAEPPATSPSLASAPVEGVSRIRDDRGLKLLVAQAPVSRAGWSAVVLQPESAAFGSIRRQLRDELLLLGFAAGISGLVAIYLGYRLSRSYRRELEAKETVDQFMSTASHELKTPLTAIKITAQLARRLVRAGLPNTDWLDEAMQDIDRATTKMTAQVNELLDVARLQQYQPITIAPRPTELVALVRRIAEELQQTTDRHLIRFETTTPELVGSFDPQRIERVITNLLDNAIKYSPVGGEIAITVTRQAPVLRAAREGGHIEQWATITVHDQGIGIPARDIPHIFERFHRARNVVGHLAGTGIGLATVRHVVEEHGGTIAVESLEGGGSTFTVRLPLDPRPGATIQGDVA